jgi:hypothetical protein
MLTLILTAYGLKDPLKNRKYVLGLALYFSKIKNTSQNISANCFVSGVFHKK